jgi:transcription initiation factor TFIID TATA-box-binding protein
VAALKEAGVNTFDVPLVAVTNVVCSYNLGKYINLNRVVITLNLENIEYEPEQFPGLVYRIKDPKIVALLFSSGKIILTGGTNLTDIKRGVDFLEQKLESII